MDIRKIILEEIGVRNPNVGDRLMYNGLITRDTPKTRVITITDVSDGNVVFDRNGKSYTFPLGEFNDHVQSKIVVYNDSVPSPNGPLKGEVYLGKTNDIRIEVVGVDEDRNSISLKYNGGSINTKYLNLVKIWIERGDWVLIQSP